MRTYYLKESLLLSYLVTSVCCLLSCVSSTDDDYLYALHTTEHFRLYYEEKVYTIHDIERIAAKKERLLANVNAIIGEDYDGTITTWLSRSGDTYANQHEETHEGWWYVNNDNGHEIIHIVTGEQWGHPRNKFLIEGIAECIQLNLESYNATEYFTSYVIEHDTRSNSMTWRDDAVSRTNQLLENYWNGSWYSYIQAGAFVCWLVQKWGYAPFKSLYRASANEQGRLLANTIQSLYGLSIEELDSTFEVLFIPDQIYPDTLDINMIFP